HVKSAHVITNRLTRETAISNFNAYLDHHQRTANLSQHGPRLPFSTYRLSLIIVDPQLTFFVTVTLFSVRCVRFCQNHYGILVTLSIIPYPFISPFTQSFRTLFPFSLLYPVSYTRPLNVSQYKSSPCTLLTTGNHIQSPSLSLALVI
ncbi:hypothetical protein F4604DRAFT_1729923, partial [Suillus subluteus]